MKAAKWSNACSKAAAAAWPTPKATLSAEGVARNFFDNNKPKTMKNKTIRTAGAVSAACLLLMSCATSPRVASNTRHSMPPAQNVHQYDGGRLVLDLQQRGGQGNFDGGGNAISSLGGGH